MYPDEARAKRVQGAVVLKATITKEGTVKDVSAVSGPVELVVSAVDAVRQWTYKPYLLNGEPTEVNTTITVNYALAGEAEAQGHLPAAQAEVERRQVPQESGGDAGVVAKRIGDGVSAPVLIYQVDPEFSEEARKAKFSGNVEVYIWVDTDGKPSHIRVVRGVGMGLDEKAVEAVRQYRFKPAMKDGKPVQVDLYIDVNFQIL